MRSIRRGLCPVQLAEILAVLATFLAMLFGVTGCGVEGLHKARPVTAIQGDQNGVSITNSKDVTVKCKRLVYAPSTKTLEVDELEIVDNASNVRLADSKQIESLAVETNAVGAAVSSGMIAGAQLAGQIFPGMFGAYRQNGGVLVPPGATSTQPVYDPNSVKAQLDKDGATTEQRCMWEEILGLPTGSLCNK